MNNIGCVVLARMSSSRLPGKVLMPINGRSPLDRILIALSDVGFGDRIVVATSMEETDDPVATWCRENGVKCFRGSLSNVARRFYEAARYIGCDGALRINADNVFFDPDLFSEVCSFFPEYDFVSNVQGRTYPKGMSLELISVSVLEEHIVEIEANSVYAEHVLKFFYEQSNILKKFVVSDSKIKAEYKDLSLDTKEDLKRLEELAIEVDSGKQIKSIICVN